MMRNEYGMRDYEGMRERDMRERGGREPFGRERERQGYGMGGRPYGGQEGEPWAGRRRGREEEEGAPIVKVIEVLAQSPHGWEDAARRAVREASETVHDIKSIYIKDFQAIVEDDHIVNFRITAKVSFAVARQRDRGSMREGRWD